MHNLVLLWKLGEIDDQQLIRLRDLLRNDPASRQLYVKYIYESVGIAALLQHDAAAEVSNGAGEHEALSSRETLRVSTIDRLYLIAARPKPLSLAAAATVMAIVVTAMYFMAPPIYRALRHARDVEEPAFVAEVSRTSAAVWQPLGQNVDAAQFLTVGDELELASGLAEIQFHRGVRVILEGPAVFRIAGDNAAALDSGKLVARVAESAYGFEVHTPVAKVRDLGTEFAVAVASAGATDLHVFQGEVEVLPAQSSGTSDTSKYLVVAGERLEIPVTGVAVRSESVDAGAQFIQRMPPKANGLRISEEYVQAIRAAAPAIYWRFEKTVDGQIANEMSPDHDLEFVGRVRLLPSDDANYSAVFGGSQQLHYAFCRDLGPLTSRAYSIELWCQPYTQTAPRMTLVGLHQSLALEFDGSYRAQPQNNCIRFVHRSPPAGVGGVDVHSGGSSTLGQWHHVVGVYAGSELRLYVDGQLAAQASAEKISPLQPTSSPLMLGRLQVEGTQARPFVGRLDEVAIYPRALEESEIRQHYDLIKKNR